jgi:outer membrane protein assembly factor BamB
MDLDTDGVLNKRDWNYMRDALRSKNGMLAIKAGGKGDMTEQNVVWSYHRSVPQLPSPLVYGDVLYMLNDSGGLIVLFKPEDGEVIVRGRLEDGLDTYYASPVAGDGKVYFVGEHGKVSVVKAGGIESVSSSDLEENVYATPAIADGRIYLRTVGALYCFGVTE